MVAVEGAEPSQPFNDLDAFIVSYARTPTGSFQGGLSHLSACDLGAIAIKGALERFPVRDVTVDDVIMGNVLSSGLGQAPASIAARLAGLPATVPATCVNKVCASGMKAVMMAANAIRAGQANVVIAGGMESMSNAPYLLPTACRSGGMRFGSQMMIDSLQHDGLVDAETALGMGLCGEKCAADNKITRQASDQYAMSTYERAIEGSKSFLPGEIVPVAARTARPAAASSAAGESLIVADEEIANFNPEKMVALRSFFKENGTVTAANASPMNDGAAALVIVSGAFLRRHRIEPLARLAGWADAAQKGVDFTTSPALAIPRALAMAGRAIGEVDYFEINEAFSAVALANAKLLGISRERVNAYGGAVALGHALGSSGARITGTLARILHDKGATVGVAAVCNGGGGASAIVLERLEVQWEARPE